MAAGRQHGFQPRSPETKDKNQYHYRFKWTGAEAPVALSEQLELTVQNQSILTALKGYNYSGPIQQGYEWFRDVLAPIVEPQTDLVSWNLRKFLDNSEKECRNLDFYISQLKTA